MRLDDRRYGKVVSQIPSSTSSCITVTEIVIDFFSKLDGNLMSIDGYFEFQLTIDDDMNEDRGENE